MQKKLDYLLNICGRLKELPRTGWIRKKIQNPETVASHSYGVALLVLLFAPKHLNKEKCLKLALIHDIQEVIVGDITPFDGISEQEKAQAEYSAIKELSSHLCFEELQNLFREYEENKTKEARFVRDLDRLDGVLQAIYYDKNLRGEEKAFDEFYKYALSHTNLDEDIIKELFMTAKKI